MIDPGKTCQTQVLLFLLLNYFVITLVVLYLCILRYCWSVSQASSSPQPDIEPPGKLKAFIVKKYVNYLETFDATFGQKYPKVYKIYRLFKDGNTVYFNILTIILLISSYRQ